MQIIASLCNFFKTLYKMLAVMQTGTQTFKKRIYYMVHVTKKYFKLRFKIFLKRNNFYPSLDCCDDI